NRAGSRWWRGWRSSRRGWRRADAVTGTRETVKKQIRKVDGETMSIQFPFSRGIFAASLSLLLLAPAAAFAQGKEAKPANSGQGRYTKKETEVKAQQTNLTKPEAPPPPKKETRPTLTVDAFRDTKTQEIQKIVDAQISKMRRLITVTADDDPQKPDFMFRLGELYADKQKYNFNAARALDQKIFELQP